MLSNFAMEAETAEGIASKLLQKFSKLKSFAKDDDVNCTDKVVIPGLG